MSTVHEIAEFLGKVALFRSLKPRQLEKLAKRIRERAYLEGDVIVEQNSMGVGLFIVVNGYAKVFRQNTDGSRIEVDQLTDGDFFGELALLDEAPRTASVIAEQPTLCLVLAKLDFLDELNEEPLMAVEMLKELAARFRRIMTNF